MQEKLIVISDHIGRIVAGRVANETDTTIDLINPTIIEQEVQGQGQLSVHTFPYMMIEFTVGGETNNVWTFNKSAIVISKVVLDDRLSNLCLSINKPQQPVAPAKDAKIVNLFDGE